jgi:hypothetical protein
LRYWLGVIAIFAVSSLSAPYIDSYLDTVGARYWLFQKQSELEWRPLIPRFVKVVLVDDSEHWGSELQGAVPIKRDYLARMVDTLSDDNARVIALDFDVRLNNPDARGAPGDYSEISADTQSGVELLVRAIAKAADKGRRIVLSKTIAFGGKAGYRLVADIYQPYGICTKLNQDGSWQNPGSARVSLSRRAQDRIACGYIGLPYDMRLLPPRLVVGEAAPLDSFSLAIAKAINPAVAAAVRRGAYYGSYIPPATIAKYHVTLRAGAVRRGDPGAADAIEGNAVIVGGQWHTAASDVGDIVDVHNTPIGPVTGAVIHENFAEAILDSRSFGYVPRWVLVATEILFGIFCAAVFAIYETLRAKLIVFAVLFVALVFGQWAMLQLFGTFFEAFIPLFGLGFHSMIERLLGRS